MKKGFAFFVISITFLFHIFSYSSNLISTKAININEIDNIDINLSYEEIEFSEIYGEEIVIDLYANNNLLLPLIEYSKNEEGRGCLIIKTSTKGHKATKGDKCKIAFYIPRNTFFNNIKISSLSPLINLSNINAKDGIFIDKGNDEGFINIKDSSFSSLKVLSSNSSISLDNIKSEYTKACTNKGNITLKLLSTDYFDITTKDGFISLSLKNVPYASSLIKSDSGNIEVFIPSINDGFELSVFSTSGILNNKIGKKRLNPRFTFKESYNNGGALIDITSVSGNIDITQY